MLQLNHLCLHQDGFRLHADWTVGQGERIAIIGPSGAGKSTLLMGIAGFLAPESGQILWDGRDLAPLAGGRATHDDSVPRSQSFRAFERCR
jgi:thiamine transport system ATP-binding protein